MSYANIRVESSGGVTRVTLDRPEQMNAFTVAMHEELRDALNDIEGHAEQTRVLVITGAGRAFCAGQDLNERARMLEAGSVDLGESIAQRYAPLVLRLRQLPIPVIAAVNGVAAGAGANLALACDLVIAARSASFIQSFSRVGLVPDCGGTWLLPRAVGRAKALGLSLLADRLSAEDAERWGMIWRCVLDDELNHVVEQTVAQLLSAAPLALANIKKAFDASAASTLEQQLQLEASMQQQLGWSEDYREGVSAFSAKRSPRFRGR